MRRQLATTNWTLIINAEATATEVRLAAMAELCEAYWFPLYVVARGRGASHDDAADLTQGFFLHLIEKHALRGLDRTAVRFRAYLAKCTLFPGGISRRSTPATKFGGHAIVPRVERDVNASVRSLSICWCDAGRACLSSRGLIKMAALCRTTGDYLSRH
jgi:hypothetical protein